MHMRFISASDAALLVELESLSAAMALHRALLARPVAGVQELVPAARTLLVHYRPAAIALPALTEALRERGAAADIHETGAQPGRTVEIPVCYDGEDLPELAELLGLDVREVIARHTGQPWQAAFAGFAPGFVYMAGGHASFRNVPRRQSPRTKVPAGAVALAGDFSAVYPSASPGGWQLIGVTGVPMWDMRRAEPAYVQPGFQVQFRDAGQAALHVSLPPLRKSEPKTPSALSGQALPAIEIVATGLQALVQDAGRAGMAGLGLSPSGALDAAAMREANRLVGNPVHAPVLENVLGGLQLRCHGQATVAVTGADAPLTLRAADGRAWPVSSRQGVALDDGDVLIVGAPTAGVRCYVAVRGGWQVEPVLGSCATDTLAQVGPPALQAGQRLLVGGQPLGAAQAAGEACPALPRPGDVVTLDVVLGPRTDWFTPEALQTFAEQEWRVTPQSNRVGMRLEGAQPLVRSRAGELPSEGTVTGAIQVPINGQPVLFLADHPLTGGYPVIGAVASHHLGLAAQIPVGCRVRFNVIAPFFEQVTP
jgi:KipI family sensor histidine kinase inhibitor